MLRFKLKPDGHKQEKKRLEEESKKAYDSAVGSAQNCLNTEGFEKYRQDYERLEKIMMEQLVFIDETEFDPTRYGFMVKDIITKYKVVGSLLRGVKSDTGKKI